MRGAGGQSLAQQATDPSAILTQMQFQNLYSASLNDADGLKFDDPANTFIVQPVIPISGGDKLPFDLTVRPTWNAVVTTSDVSSQATGQRLQNGTTAIGDTELLSLAVFQTKFGTVGVGASNVFPTGTDRRTSLSKWEAGPAAFTILRAIPKWTLGALVFHNWSFASTRSNAEDVSLTSFQPVAVRHFEGGWYAGLGDEDYTYNWKTEKLNLPINVRVGKVFKIGDQPFNFFAQPYYNVNHGGAGSGDYGFKLNLTFLLPEIKLGWQSSK